MNKNNAVLRLAVVALALFDIGWLFWEVLDQRAWGYLPAMAIIYFLAGRVLYVEVGLWKRTAPTASTSERRAGHRP